MASTAVNKVQESKPHAVCIPFPSQGHIRPMLNLAKLLHSKLGFHITFVNTEFNHHRLLRSRGLESLSRLPSFRFEAFPDGLPPSDLDATQDIPTLCRAILNNQLFEPFKRVLRKIVNDGQDSASDVPRVMLVVADAVMPFTMDAAKDVSLPVVLLWTASACGMLAYAECQSLIDKGILPFKDASRIDDYLGMEMEVPPAPMRGMRFKDMPSFIRTTDMHHVMNAFHLVAVKRSCKSGFPIIFNTFHAFDHDVLRSISNIAVGPLCTLGPLQLHMKQLESDDQINSLGSNLWKEDTDCLRWLDCQRPKSVIYISFGSITTMSNQNLIEFAWGLANSNMPFLWIIRRDLVAGESAVVPAIFVEETRDRGMLANWCDQEKVLSHPATATFLTHAGWNSTIESISSGVPVMCWPFFAEQPTNCWFSCNKWGIGVEVDKDVKRDAVEAQVREMMEAEKGKEMRRKAEEWRRLAVEAVLPPNGSSYMDFAKFIKQLQHVENHF